MTEVLLERGKKRVFAVAIDWPGWARAGRDEDGALETLFAYGPRYAAALGGTRLRFPAPKRREDLVVVERVEGTATTDFGAPDVPASRDQDDVDAKELTRLEAILAATSRTFDAAVARAEGVELAKGPRGGGRDVGAIVEHVVGADASYVRMIGGKGDAEDVEAVRAAVTDALTVAVRDGVPPSPRGGKRWTPRYFVRRSAWHVLDHAWEIEDRTPA